MPGLFRRPPQPLQRRPGQPYLRSKYYSLIRRDGPRSYWRLGETSGTTAVDEIGANNGTYQNSGSIVSATSLISGDADPSVDFNAVGFVRAANVTLSANISLEVWQN